MERFQDFARNVLTGAPAPLATITVYLAGTTTPAALYSANLVGVDPPLANPTTAAALTGQFGFYAANGRYDIQVSAAGITTYTLSDQLLDDPS